MGIPVDSTLDFEQLTSAPSSQSGSTKLYVYQDGQLYIRDFVAVGDPGPAKVMTNQNRPPAIYFTNETGTPVVPDNVSSPLYGTAIQSGDFVVRESDGEVFQWIKSSSPAVDTMSDLSFSLGPVGVNSVTNTIARAYATAGTTLGPGWTKVALGGIDFDPGSNFSTANSQYTCPVAGYYEVQGEVTTTSTVAGQDIYGFLTKNNTPGTPGQEFYSPQSSAAAQSMHVTGTTILACAAGDTISLYAACNTGAPITTTGEYHCALSVNLLAPLTNAPVTPNTGARAYRNAAFNTVVGWQKLPIDTIDTDPGGHMDVTTNQRCNIASAGWYQVAGRGTVLSTASGQTLRTNVNKNGVGVISGPPVTSAGSGVNLAADAVDMIYCLAGDYLETWVNPSVPLALVTGDAFCSLSVVKVDQPVAQSQPVAPLYSSLTVGGGMSTTSTAYTTTPTLSGGATAVPSVNITAPGIYDVEIGAYMRNASAGTSALIAPSGAGIAASDNNAAQVDSTGASNGESAQIISRLVLTAGTLSLALRASAGTASAYRAYIRATLVSQ